MKQVVNNGHRGDKNDLFCIYNSGMAGEIQKWATSDPNYVHKFLKNTQG